MKKGLIAIFILISAQVFCQKPKVYNSSEIYHALEKLNFLGSALYIAAHPDDENTRLISHLSNDRKARTAYLSLTRGDGGQNLIGTEIQELLGVLRTQELMMARSVDGGQQFFSRAIDFGYSKHPDETLAIWNKDEVLSDVVRIIRRFKPDIIINRFDHRTPGKTHGHHTASAVLSVEAFDLVNDASKYPDQLNSEETWKPQRLYFNTSWWFYGGRDKFAKADKSNLISMDIGTFYPLLGKSNTEIAAEARSMHRCQGMGSTPSRGTYTEYLELLKGDLPSGKSNPFEEINTTWSRVEGGAKIGEAIAEVMENFDFGNPAASVSDLAKVYQMISKIGDKHWKEIKLKEIETIISACTGLFLEASASVHRVTHGDALELKIECINRSPANFKLNGYQIKPVNISNDTSLNLANNVSFENYENFTIDKNTKPSSHYWLREKWDLGMFKVPSNDFIGMPNTPRSLTIDFDLTLDGIPMTITKDIIYKFTDPSLGEVYRPFEVTDPVYVSIEEDVLIFPNAQTKNISVSVEAGKADIEGEIKLDVPEGWIVSPMKYSYKLNIPGSLQKFKFEITPPQYQATGQITPIATYSGKEYSSDLVEIAYQHIPFQSVLKKESAKIARIEIETRGNKIGYIMGAGDKVPECLEYIGYSVDRIEIEQAETSFLNQYDAIIMGIRALNTIDNIDVYRDNLMAYVKEGGTLITQYNTSRRLKSKQFGPYPMELGRFRVSQEDAPIKILAQDHPIVNFPNKITSKDFDNWIQERGLYFASEWDENYTPIFSSFDEGEDPGSGSTLVAKYGEGYYVYSSLSWFRELPAGVPGAYRIFANMIALGNEEKP